MLEPHASAADLPRPELQELESVSDRSESSADDEAPCISCAIMYPETLLHQVFFAAEFLRMAFFTTSEEEGLLSVLGFRSSAVSQPHLT